MSTPKKSLSKHALIIIILLCVTILTATGTTEYFIKHIGLNKLTESNDQYLNRAFQRSIHTFGVLSAVKVGLAIFKGTEIGVGINLQVGDVVQSAYDYVDLAWRTVLLSTVVLLGTRYLLQMADIVDHWFLFGTLILLMLRMLIIRIKKLLRLGQLLQDVCLVTSVFTVALYLLLPLSIAGGRYLSEQITAPSVQEAEAGFSTLRNDLLPTKDGNGGLLSKLKDAKNRIKHIGTYLTQKTSQLSEWVLKLIAGFIFDAVVFPLTLFVFLFWITRLIARYLFQIKLHRTFKQDLENMFSRYYSSPKS